MSDEACSTIKQARSFCRPSFNKHIALFLWQNRIFDMDDCAPIKPFGVECNFVKDKIISAKQGTKLTLFSNGIQKMHTIL